jgi:hypothetical protein
MIEGKGKSAEAGRTEVRVEALRATFLSARLKPCP